MSWWNRTACKPGETSCARFESHLDPTVHELCVKRIHNSHPFSGKRRSSIDLWRMYKHIPLTLCVFLLRTMQPRKTKGMELWNPFAWMSALAEQRQEGKTKAIQESERPATSPWRNDRVSWSAREHYRIQQFWTRASVRWNVPLLLKFPFKKKQEMHLPTCSVSFLLCNAFRWERVLKGVILHLDFPK